MVPIDFHSGEINTMEVSGDHQLFNYQHSSRYLLICSERNIFGLERHEAEEIMSKLSFLCELSLELSLPEKIYFCFQFFFMIWVSVAQYIATRLSDFILDLKYIIEVQFQQATEISVFPHSSR